MASSNNSSELNNYRSFAEKLITIDENEEDKYGQKVSKIFHDADYIVNIDSLESEVRNQIKRFCELLFSSNSKSPTKLEYGMFFAKAAALRSLDLSRQVGAAVFSENGEILSLGSNEVPKAGGGTYWEDGESNFDARDYTRKSDPNVVRKREIISELVQNIESKTTLEEDVLQRDSVKNSQLMDILEFGRIVHAEMSAITDAARTGRRLQDSTLFCTTYPCHMCAKHIVASGISKVYFLEPYPKSLSESLHGDAISFEGAERGEYQNYPSVEFLHFFGATPRRYRDFFERGKRKNDKGHFQNYIDDVKRPNINIKSPYYIQTESLVLDHLRNLISNN